MTNQSNVTGPRFGFTDWLRSTNKIKFNFVWSNCLTFMDSRVDNLGQMRYFHIHVWLNVAWMSGKMSVWKDVCLDVLLDIRLDVWSDVCLDVWSDARPDVRSDVCLDSWSDVCLDIWSDLCLDVCSEFRCPPGCLLWCLPGCLAGWSAGSDRNHLAGLNCTDLNEH